VLLTVAGMGLVAIMSFLKRVGSKARCDSALIFGPAQTKSPVRRRYEMLKRRPDPACQREAMRLYSGHPQMLPLRRMHHFTGAP
jgi:hypothetical protein